jgi:hypothetical protein
VRDKVEIDAVIYYKAHYDQKKMNAKEIKSEIVDLFHSLYLILGNVKSFEDCLTKWGSHVDALLKDVQSKEFQFLHIQRRLKEKLNRTTRLTTKQKNDCLIKINKFKNLTY